MAKFTCNFISYIFKRTVDMTVIIPSITIPESIGMSGGLRAAKDRALMDMEGPEYSSYVGKPKFPVLYLLHGMGNNHATWTGYTNVELYAEERNMAVVMISAENKCYVNNESGDEFFDFLEKEVMDFVCGMFPVLQRMEDTYIAGLSMGGYGAIVHSFNCPEKFRSVGIFSAALGLNPSLLSIGKDLPIPEEYDPYLLLEKEKKEKKKLPSYYFACGEEDAEITSNKAFMEQLKECGVECTWEQLPGYAHVWRFWNEEVERFMDWLPRTDAYAGKGKRRI